MTDKNLLYFMTRLGECMSSAEVSLSTAELVLVQLRRQAINAVGNRTDQEEHRPQDFVHHVTTMKVCLVSAGEVINEAVGWFRDSCPEPTATRDLRRELNQLDAQCRLAPLGTLDYPAERAFNSEGVVPGVFNYLEEYLEVVRDSCKRLSRHATEVGLWHQPLPAAKLAVPVLLKVHDELLQLRDFWEPPRRLYHELSRRTVRIYLG